MTFGLIRKRVVWALAIALLILGAFIFGFVSCLNLKSTVSHDLRQQYLLQAGNAPLPVREGVLAALRDFQEGYVKRDPKELNSFMNRLFPKSDDVLLLGTDADEWVRGYPAVGDFIRADWVNWGDFRFAVNDSIVWSSGDVAWIASVGAVRENGSDRPLRFSAILTRNGSNWLFRQVHFQWDDRDPGLADLLHPGVQLKLFKLMLERVRSAVQSAGNNLLLTGTRRPPFRSFSPYPDGLFQV